MANRPKRPRAGEGRTSHANINGAALGAAFGGGGATAGYDEAAEAIKGGALSSPGSGYDPRAATSAKGVLTPELQKAYDAGPIQPLNWLGKATGQPDLYSQFQMQKAVSSINLDHDKQMEALRNSNLTEQEKQRYAHQLELQTQGQIGALVPGATPTQIAAFRSNIDPYAGQIGASAGRQSLNATMLKGTEADIANARLMSPGGRQEHTASLSAQDAAQAAVNSHLGASSWAALHPVLGPGSAMMSSDLFGPGTSVVNDKAPTMQEQMMARAMGMPTPGPNELMFSKFGERYNIGPKNPMGAGAGQVLGPSFGAGPGYQNNPAGFPVTPSPDIGAGLQPTPLSIAPQGPAAAYQSMLQALGSGMNAVGRGINTGVGYVGGLSAPGMAPQAPTMADLIKQQEEEKRRQLLMPAY